ncbi:MAG: HAD family hydrolase [Pseudomonadota bacterium]
MKSLKAALLDVDGTLVNSNDAHALAWFEVLSRNGYAVALGQVRQLIGEGGDKLIPQVTGLDPASHEAKRLSAERGARFERVYLPQLRAFPRASELLALLQAAGLRIVVASSAKDQELRPLLELCGAARYVEEQTSSDDASHSKPDPDIVQVALAKARCLPGEAIMLGDTPYDIAAAARAGVRAIAVRSGGHPDSALGGAIAIYDDVADLVANFAGSAFSSGTA